MSITVPRAKQEVAPSALPGVRVSTDAPSAAFGLGFAEINQAAQNLFAKEKEKADMAAFYEADLKAAKAQSSLDINNKTRLKGKDAAGAADNADIAFQDTGAEIAKGLSNDNQRSMFERSMIQRRAALYSSLEHHAGGEIYKYQVGVFEASIVEHKNAAVQNANRLVIGDAVGADIGVRGVANSFDALREAARHRAELDGLDETQTKLFIDQHVSDAIRASIEVLSDNGNDIVATRFREMYKDQIIGEKDTQAINKAIEFGSVKGVSLRTANALGDEYPGDLSAQLKALRGMFNDGKMGAAAHDATKVRLEHEDQLRKSQQKQAHDDEFIKQYHNVIKTRDMSSVPVAVLNTLTPAELKAMKEAAAGIEPETNYKVYTKIMLTPPTVMAGWSDADLMRDARPHLDNSDYERVVSRVNAIRDAKAGADANVALTSMQSNTELMVNEFERTMGVPKEKWTDDNEIEFAFYSSAVSKGINEYETFEKRKATEKEKRKIIGDVAAQKVTDPGGWFSFAKEKIASTVSKKEYEEGKLIVPMEKIPPKAQQNIVASFRRAGVVSGTDAQILATHKKEIEKYHAMAMGGVSHDGAMAALFKPTSYGFYGSRR